MRPSGSIRPAQIPAASVSQPPGLARVAQLRDQVAAGLTTTFASSYTAQVSLPGALSLEAIAGYGRQATGSKYVIIPNPAA
jgi:NADPH:quinone reductase